MELAAQDDIAGIQQGRGQKISPFKISHEAGQCLKGFFALGGGYGGVWGFVFGGFEAGLYR
jgi:hypothetical protein